MSSQLVSKNISKILLTYEKFKINCQTELLKDAFMSKVSIFQLVLEALKVESGFILLVTVFFLVALVPFCVTLGWLCSNSSCFNNDDFNSTPVDTLMTIDESWQDDINCTKRSLQLFLQIIILLLM